MMFEYKGLQAPTFDKNEFYHVFVTLEGETTPLEQRGTQIYFDTDGNVQWIKFYRPMDSELHSVVKVEEAKFTDNDFMIEGCTEANATSNEEDYMVEEEQPQIVIQ